MASLSNQCVSIRLWSMLMKSNLWNCMTLPSLLWFIQAKYTAISIYVVGWKLQGYETSAKQLQPSSSTWSSTWNPNISFSQMAHHLRSLLYGRGIVILLIVTVKIPYSPSVFSCRLMRLWSDNVNWISCKHVTANLAAN